MVYDDTNCTLMKPQQIFYLSAGVPHRVQLAKGCNYAKALVVYAKKESPLEP